MASEIKTRIARKDIKAIDKAATIAQHMKHSSVQIKERAEQTQEQREHSPVEYAQGRIADNAERVSRGAAAQVKNQSGKAVKHVKEKQRLKRDTERIKRGTHSGTGRASFFFSVRRRKRLPAERADDKNSTVAGGTEKGCRKQPKASSEKDSTDCPYSGTERKRY